MRSLAFSLLCSIVASASLAQDSRGLEDLFSPGFLVEDRNGDGLADFVRAGLALGESPSPGVIAAASDVAARLGFETMAMDLPLAGTAGGPVIEFRGAVGTLRAGEGGVTLEPGRVVVSGADDEGLRAAAAALAGRMPHLWDPEGPTLGTVLADVSSRLGFTPRSARAEEMRFTREGVALLKLVIEVSAEELERAREALTGVLSYEHVEVVAARLVAGSRSVEIGISTKPAPIVGAPSPPRPGAAAKHDLDLSNLYTPEGLLGDSDQNLIADRLDAVLSPGERHPATMDLAARLGLEGAGISIPIVKLPSEIESPEDEPTLILVGEHPLLPVGTVALDEGVGSIRVIPRAFGEKPALAIQGGDEAGVARALDQLASPGEPARTRPISASSRSKWSCPSPTRRSASSARFCLRWTPFTRMSISPL